jgi:hypothetical protein
MRNLIKTLTAQGSELFGSGSSLLQTGLTDTAKASRYYSDILSGDPTKIMAAAAPEIKSITGQVDQQKKEATITGNRAGGTNAGLQKLEDTTRGQIGDVTAKQKPIAASGLERTGAEVSRLGISETGLALGAEGTAASTASTLESNAINSRQVSQKIHDEAVAAWTKLITEAISMIPTGGTSLPASPGDSILFGGSDPSICWIAKAIYGDNDPRVDLARFWIKSRVNPLIVAAYKRYGERIAQFIGRGSFLKMLLRPLFDRAVSNALGVLAKKSQEIIPEETIDYESVEYQR